jgi:hypothetical protein
MKNLKDLRFQSGLLSTAKNALGVKVIELFKSVLKYLNIGYTDPCCDDSFTPEGVSGQRFGFTEEDDTSTTSRIFDMNGNTFVFDDFTNGNSTEVQLNYTLDRYSKNGVGLGVGTTDFTSNQVILGDIQGNKGYVRLYVSPDQSMIRAVAGTAFNKYNYLKLDIANQKYEIGDIDAASSGNNTKITIDDLAQRITVSNVPVYANNTAALGAGLTVGMLYRAGDSLNIVY